MAADVLILNWQTGIPPRPDLYFVAHEYAQGVGAFEMMEWDGKKWDCYPDTKVIAFLAWGDFKAQLNLKWPGELPEPPPRRPLSESETTYEEV